MIRARSKAEVDAYMDGYRAAFCDIHEHGPDAARRHILLMADLPPDTRCSFLRPAVGRRHEPKHPDAVGNRERQRANQPKGEA